MGRRLRGSAKFLGCQALALGYVQGAFGFCPEVVFLTRTGSWDPQGRVLGVVMQGREQQRLFAIEFNASDVVKHGYWVGLV